MDPELALKLLEPPYFAVIVSVPNGNEDTGTVNEAVPDEIVAGPSDTVVPPPTDER